MIHSTLDKDSNLMRATVPMFATLFLAGCGQTAGNEARAPAAPASAEAPLSGKAYAPSAPPAATPAPAPAPAPAAERWDLQASGEGTALALLSGSGGTSMRLFCPAGGDRLLVNVRGFRPVGSEERLSFGSGGTVAALVADSRGDRQRGGVSAAGPVPAELAALLAGPFAVNYGSQNSGPHSAPPARLAGAFVAACRERTPAAAPAPAPPPASTASGPAAACTTQGQARLANPPLRAVGTEPFWAARIEGRCVTYSHPDDQQGTRVWTRFTAGPGGGGSWVGALRGRPFELRVRPQPGCSDGMSDRRYAFAAELLVGGERRRGCADRG